MSCSFDVIVVGAGPAGSTLAAFLGQAGRRVLLLDRATFPREKPCGEYMSPETLATLSRSGVLEAVEALPHRKLRGHEIHSYDGSMLRGTYRTLPGYQPFRPYGIAIRRTLFDQVLLRRAASFPSVAVKEGFRVEALLRDGGKVTGVRGRGADGEQAFEAPLTVGADGVNSIVARELGLTVMDPEVRKCGIVGYWKGMEPGEYGELHLGRPGYFALAPVDDGTVNINFVVDQEDLKDAHGDAGAWYRHHLSRHPVLSGRLRGAVCEESIRVTGPIARRSRGAVAPGALLIGDAAEFVDPVTGEGLFIAVRSAEVAAEAIAAGGAVLEEYARRREREFGERLRGCWRVQRHLYRPWLVNYVVRTLGGKQELADLVIGMSGDYIPPGAVFNLSFYLAFLNPFYRRRTAQGDGKATG